MARQFAVLGDAFVDIIVGPLEKLPSWGEDSESKDPILLLPGGSALNTAVHLASLFKTSTRKEDQVTLYSAVGTDDFAETLKQKLINSNVRFIAETLSNVPTGVCIVLSGCNNRSFITHYGAVGEFSVESINLDYLLNAEHIHLAGFYSCSKLSKAILPVLKLAKSKGITISLDTNYDSSEQWKEVDEILPFINVFLPNDLEAMKISKTKTVEEALIYFSNKVPVIAITLGSLGVKAIETFCDTNIKKTYFFQALPVTPVDVTGAGDSFNAGFIYGWKVKKSVEEGLKIGIRVAALNIQQLGACSKTFTLEQVEEINIDTKQ